MTFSVCVDVVLEVPASAVEVNLSRRVGIGIGIGLGQSAAARSLAVGWQMGSALLGDFLGCEVEAFNSKHGHLYHRIA